MTNAVLNFLRPLSTLFLWPVSLDRERHSRENARQNQPAKLLCIESQGVCGEIYR